MLRRPVRGRLVGAGVEFLAMTPEQIAAGLTEDARHYLPQLKKRFSIPPGMQTSSVRSFLLSAERDGLLTNPSFDNYFLTPLGQQVRAILEKNNERG